MFAIAARAILAKNSQKSTQLLHVKKSTQVLKVIGTQWECTSKYERDHIIGVPSAHHS